MKKAFLFAASLCLLVGSLTGCRNYTTNLSNKIQKIRLSEGAIQNISKYKAIGVGTIDKSFPQKRYKFIDKEADETDNSIDYSYNLLGMTENGLIEELTFLANNGKEVKSSNFNITYYEEIGDDFVLFSYLPMKVETYISSFKNWMKRDFDYKDLTNEEMERTCYSTIINPINKLRYPIMWSIKTSSGFIDTSFLVHKNSGKVFPFSMHKEYIDPSKVRGWLEYNVLINENETNLTAADMMFDHVGRKGPNFVDNVQANYFKNGFIACESYGGSWGTFDGIEGNFNGVSVLTFDEETQNIAVDAIRTITVDCNLSSSELYGKCDKWGNIIVQFPNDYESHYLYNAINKSIKKLENFDINSLWFDSATRQFCITGYGAREGITFLDENFEVDYTLSLSGELAFQGLSFACLNRKEKIYWTNDGIIKINLDENGHYTPTSYTLLSTPEVWIGENAYAYGNYYYAKEGNIYKVDASNNYEIIKLADLDYRINTVYVNEYDILTFNGVDLSTLQEVIGFITADDTVTFEINPNSNKTTIFTPIN